MMEVTVTLRTAVVDATVAPAGAGERAQGEFRVNLTMHIGLWSLERVKELKGGRQKLNDIGSPALQYRN